MSISAASPLVQPRRTRLFRLAEYAAGGVVGVLAATSGIGPAYESIATAWEGPDAPLAGRLVEVEGRRMHIDCRGAGRPTVVMDAGLGGASLDWFLVQPAVQATTRVCVYDRAGMGWSEPVSGPRTPLQHANELHTLLTAAGKSGRYIMVGHSLAGKNFRLFASTFPEEVEGLVLVDAHSEAVDQPMSIDDTAEFNAALECQTDSYSLARHVGLVRIVVAKGSGHHVQLERPELVAAATAQLVAAAHARN